MKLEADKQKEIQYRQSKKLISFKEYGLLKIYINKIWSEAVIQYVQKIPKKSDEFVQKGISMCDECHLRYKIWH